MSAVKPHSRDPLSGEMQCGGGGGGRQIIQMNDELFCLQNCV